MYVICKPVAILYTQPESVLEEVGSGLNKDFPWSKMLTELTNVQSLVNRTGERFVRIWEVATSYEERNSALKSLHNGIDHKLVSKRTIMLVCVFYIVLLLYSY